jgi:hypothetical protein
MQHLVDSHLAVVHGRALGELRLGPSHPCQQRLVHTVRHALDLMHRHIVPAPPHPPARSPSTRAALSTQLAMAQHPRMGVRGRCRRAVASESRRVDACGAVEGSCVLVWVESDGHAEHITGMMAAGRNGDALVRVACGWVLPPRPGGGGYVA